MVLESLINPLAAESKPQKMILFGALYSTVGIGLALWVFQSQASLVMVFLTTLACVPLMYGTMKLEEEKDETIQEEKTLLKEHAKALEFFIFLFIGMVISMAFWYTVLPEGVVENLFSVQSDTISRINASPTGRAIMFGLFSTIFLNNLQVMVFSLLFSFLYGVGAIFILSWNASVIAAAIGNIFRSGIAKAAALFGMEKFSHYMDVFSLGVFRYSIHGIPEILGYFVAGLAGGIVSIAILKHGLDYEKFKRIVTDTTDLLILAVAIIFAAALLEVFVTPLLF